MSDFSKCAASLGIYNRDGEPLPQSRVNCIKDAGHDGRRHESLSGLTWTGMHQWWCQGQTKEPPPPPTEKATSRDEGVHGIPMHPAPASTVFYALHVQYFKLPMRLVWGEPIRRRAQAKLTVHPNGDTVVEVKLQDLRESREWSEILQATTNSEDWLPVNRIDWTREDETYVSLFEATLNLALMGAASLDRGGR